MKTFIKGNMKKIILLLVLFAAVNIYLARSFDTNKQIVSVADSLVTVMPDEHFSDENLLINTLLSRYHYNKKTKLNDSISSVIFDRYLKALDFSKSYFVQSDLDQFEKDRFKYDDYLKEGYLDPAFNIFNTFKQRVDERMSFVKSLFENEFDFSIDEFYQLKREKAPWPANSSEANEIWRKRLKNDALILKLDGTEWEKIKERLIKRYDNYRKAIFQYSAEDIFQLVMNSYTEVVDPHTNYLSPATSENFKISMSLSLEGIGAQLQTEDEYTKVVEIIPGGPAYKSNLLHRDDKIVGVAQGDDGEMIDVLGWKITDVVQLIRGPKETIVRLQIIPADGGQNASIKEITLKRDKVKLEEQAAKKEIIEIKNEGKTFRIGVINIPAFYSDFEAIQRGDKDYKSTTRDVRLLLDSLNNEKVDGVIIDLRNDGGGSLDEAIRLTGLFITDGPIVQVKNSDEKIDVGNDPDRAIIYDGPMAVLVNRFSASASEIFAGAIQDYGRGLIVGEQTFGKGTVQNLIDLNRLRPKSDIPSGQLKITIAKYYRINGGSTQHLGVVPDISFPSAIDPSDFGESAEPSALPWDQIKPIQYQVYGNLKTIIPALNEKHEKRIKSNSEFDYLLEEIEDYRSAKNKVEISLNETVRKKEKEIEDEKRFQRENERRSRLGLKLLQKGEVANRDEKQIDPLLKEGAIILSDLILLTIG